MDAEMPDLSPGSDSVCDTVIKPTGSSTTDTPRWVMVFGSIVIALVLIFVIVHLAGGGLGEHVPS